MTDAPLKRAGWAPQRRTPALKTLEVRPQITCVTARQPTPAESTTAGSVLVAAPITWDSRADILRALLRAILPTLCSSRVMALEITEAFRATRRHRMEADTQWATIIRTQTQLGKKRTNRRVDPAEAARGAVEVAPDQAEAALGAVEAAAADQAEVAVDQAEVARGAVAHQAEVAAVAHQAEVATAVATAVAQTEEEEGEGVAEETSRQPSEATRTADRPATTPTAATTTNTLTTPSSAMTAICTNPFTTTPWCRSRAHTLEVSRAPAKARTTGTAPRASTPRSLFFLLDSSSKRVVDVFQPKLTDNTGGGEFLI